MQNLLTSARSCAFNQPSMPRHLKRPGVRDDPNFETFVESLKNAPTSGLGKDAEYALWINTYNALAIKMVTDNPCKKSLFRTKMTTSIKGMKNDSPGVGQQGK